MYEAINWRAHGGDITKEKNKTFKKSKKLVIKLMNWSSGKAVVDCNNDSYLLIFSVGINNDYNWYFASF